MASDEHSGSPVDAPAVQQSMSQQASLGKVAVARAFAKRAERLIHRRVTAPPRNLLLTALVVFVFPWDDLLIDAVGRAAPGLPVFLVYLPWVLFDCVLIAVVLASAGRPVFVYVVVTAVLDTITAFYYATVAKYSTFDLVAGAVLDVAYVSLIWIVLRVAVSEGDRDPGWRGRWLGTRAEPKARKETQTSNAERAVPLSRFVIPFVVSVGVAYAASLAASVTCTNHICGGYGPRVASGFFDQAAHIIAVLLVALAIEARLLIDQQGERRREERALVTITVIGLALGIGASLTASAADAQDLPLTFELTVQALALGLATIVMLPGLKRSDSGDE